MSSDDNPRSAFDGRNLTAHIVHDLGRAIVTERYSSGQAFPVEADLCRQYDASRPVLREAVKMLTAKGLLSARPRQGTRVQPESQWNLLDPDVLRWMLERKFSIDLLIEFTDVRLAIEPRAAALAAAVATGAQRAQIMAAIDRMVAADNGDDDALAADIAFHVAVLNASNNRFLRQFTDLAETTLRFSIRRTNEYKGVPRASAEEHKRVADAIAAGDAERAAGEMRTLIEGALNLLLTRGGLPSRPRA
ncbi:MULTISPECIES: FadR/GntR family transcriptional regulator [Sphingomonas]|uniref:FadR family transcriptional regulator n=1 Tax=Edaphosphingomonas fennica TaxID=114404 RepID=A0A2T4HT59_9SPHN|nr:MULTISPECIES: FCD domain-containing protein [Sphingomonas]AGH49659.1 GntR family transcriptional regulator [Sphingomonas sp. MM-1]PTD18972.1 FadR family transcriptional regulator [Sphingomonas fennica]